MIKRRWIRFFSIIFAIGITFSICVSPAMPKYSFSKRSLSNLKGVHPDLVRLAHRAINRGVMDFSIRSGERGKAAQNKAYADGRSYVKWPHSRHNRKQGELYVTAIDVSPYPVDWGDIKAFEALGALLMKVASEEEISLQWGRYFKIRDTCGKLVPFADWGHFQLPIYYKSGDSVAIP